MTKGGNQACILCSAVLALISCPKCRAAVCTIHLLRNATVESFLLEHKCANEKLEISLHDTPAFMQKVFLQAQIPNTVECLGRTERTLFFPMSTSFLLLACGRMTRLSFDQRRRLFVIIDQEGCCRLSERRVVVAIKALMWVVYFICCTKC